jgi:hypothetical protein
MPSSIDAAFALDDLRTIREVRALDVRRRYEEAEQAARTYTDPNLSAEGLERRRAEMRDRARAALAEDVAELERTAARAADTVRRAAAAADQGPTDPSEALLAEMRQSRAWDRARLLLESGRPVGEVIASADLDTLRALRAELPAYLTAQTERPAGTEGGSWTEVDTAAVARTVEKTLADRLPGDQGAALRSRLELEAIEPGLTVTLAGLRRLADGVAVEGDGLRTAIEARLADGAARATLPTAPAA